MSGTWNSEWHGVGQLLAAEDWTTFPRPTVPLRPGTAPVLLDATLTTQPGTRTESK